jgi:hypothetical protein
MIEFRTLVKKENREDVLPKISSILTDINPCAKVRTEVLSSSTLVWIRFPQIGQLEDFITAISMRHLEIDEWNVYETPKPRQHAGSPEACRELSSPCF